ncbi:MAG TPA: LLM class flavin-dependent oxidoreductase [Actinomycetota bacterium]|jgi:5,10-methylenetetrahydromethanopterin reductase
MSLPDGRGTESPARFGVALSNEVPLEESVAMARRAEELGFDEVWVPESRHGRSATTAAAVLARETSRIGIGVGVVNPFWRHPSLIAMEAAALDEASGGRLRLGIGAALWTLRALGEDDERTHHPLAAMIEAVRVVKAMLAGEDGVDGEVFRVRADARLDFEPHRRRIPVYVGAVNRKMMEAAGAWADGVYLGAITSPGYVRWARERMAEGARSAGREHDGLDLCANILTSVSKDAKSARDACRQVLTYYLWRVEPVVYETSGADPEAVAFVRSKVPEDGLDAVAEILPGELIDVFAAAGTPDTVMAKLGEFEEAGLKGLLAWYVFGPDPDEGLRLLIEAARAR